MPRRQAASMFKLALRIPMSISQCTWPANVPGENTWHGKYGSFSVSDTNTTQYKHIPNVFLLIWQISKHVPYHLIDTFPLDNWLRMIIWAETISICISVCSHGLSTVCKVFYFRFQMFVRDQPHKLVQRLPWVAVIKQLNKIAFTEIHTILVTEDYYGDLGRMAF